MRVRRDREGVHIDGPSRVRNRRLGTDSGTPTVAGTASLTFLVIDSFSSTATKALTLTVNPARGGSVALDTLGPSSGGASVSSSASLSWTHVMGSGSNTLLTVGVAVGVRSGADGSYSVAARDKGVAMVSAGRVDAGNDGHDFAQLVYLLSLPSGSNTLQVTLTGGIADLVGGKMSFTGVNATTPVRDVTTGTGISTSASATASSAPGDMVVDVLATGTSVTSSKQTLRWKKNLNASSGAGNGAQSTAAGASSVTMGYAVPSDDWALIAMDVVHQQYSRHPRTPATRLVQVLGAA